MLYSLYREVTLWYLDKLTWASTRSRTVFHPVGMHSMYYQHLLPLSNMSFHQKKLQQSRLQNQTTDTEVHWTNKHTISTHTTLCNAGKIHPSNNHPCIYHHTLYPFINLSLNANIFRKTIRVFTYRPSDRHLYHTKMPLRTSDWPRSVSCLR